MKKKKVERMPLPPPPKEKAKAPEAPPAPPEKKEKRCYVKCSSLTCGSIIIERGTEITEAFARERNLDIEHLLLRDLIEIK